MGHARTPCPACGQNNIRETGKICWKCERLMEDGRKYRELQERNTDYLLYYYDIAGCPGAYGTESHETYIHALQDLFRFLDQPGRIDSGSLHLFSSHPLRQVSSCYRHAVRLQPQLRDIIDALDGAVREMVALAYDAGVKEGSQLLVGLANGKITLAEFEEKTSTI